MSYSQLDSIAESMQVSKGSVDGALQLLKANIKIHDRLISLGKDPRAGAAVPFLIGPAGVGKTQIVKQLARETGRELKIIRMNHTTPGSMSLPWPDKNDPERFRSTIPNYFPKNPKGKYIVFFDEINRCPKDVIPFLFSLLGDGEIAGVKLPTDCFMVCAGNPQDDNYDVTDFSDPAMTRRIAYFAVGCNASEWLDWADKNNVHSFVKNYIKEHPGELYDESVAGKSAGVPFANPASWEKLSEVLQTIDFSDINNFDIVQAIGAGLINSSKMANFYSEAISAIYNNSEGIDVFDFADNPTKYKTQIENLIKNDQVVFLDNLVQAAQQHIWSDVFKVLQLDGKQYKAKAGDVDDAMKRVSDLVNMCNTKSEPYLFVSQMTHVGDYLNQVLANKSIKPASRMQFAKTVTKYKIMKNRELARLAVEKSMSNMQDEK